MSRSTQPIKSVSDYFKTDEIPFIVQEYWPQRGWTRGTMNKRVSRSWLRKLKAAGITHIALSLDKIERAHAGRSRVVDFSVAELLRGA